jgi:hypothetical protein
MDKGQTNRDAQGGISYEEGFWAVKGWSGMAESLEEAKKWRQR